MRSLKKRVENEQPNPKVKFDKFDKNKPPETFKPLEDKFSRSYIVKLETMLLRVTKKELDMEREASIYPPLGIYYAPSNRKSKPRKRLPYLPKLIKE